MAINIYVYDSRIYANGIVAEDAILPSEADEELVGAEEPKPANVCFEFKSDTPVHSMAYETDSMHKLRLLLNEVGTSDEVINDFQVCLVLLESRGFQLMGPA